MRRRLLNLLAALSLLPCVTAAMAWRPSLHSSRLANWVREDSAGRRVEVGLMLSRGRLFADYRRWTPAGPDSRLNEEERPGFHYTLDLPWLRSPDFMGFGVSTSADNRWVAVPLWFVAALAAVPPFARTAARLRRRRARPPGCCAACGYDLRASPERCPECGRTTDRSS